ncbi:uncharacterized protein EI97DRAFT_396574 [Westerdykella ornata]|uniref:tRNA(Phe) 7-[(3-amino-3-carboxypropyl)-4-demethylwyosine(37)-N(4)]-methyltransferase n=1 Tax=Westerdykella ornata TaxID=318751 RepID=A0A6A6JND6_WESOR|nr:uncharacterized protein EI97DRAFT_396574 [Westerdykella ornata]KAF2277633.1 hypothetical protein EI97DRAFT_396574 [Westerdykella ornata]
MQSRFEGKKQRILESLRTPEQDYHDLSPKGSVDELIRPLIGDINRVPGLVTTSSCSGRVSVFCDGGRTGQNNDSVGERDSATSRAGLGGKGHGSWLYVSHNTIEIPQDWPQSSFMSMFEMRPPAIDQESPTESNSYIHLKFEPMILHILTASLEDSHRVLTAALSAGFRESGAVSLGASKAGDVNPMVAVRSTGYSFDSIIGFQDFEGQNYAMVSEACLRNLVNIANSRFRVNQERINRFQKALLEQYAQKEVDNKPNFTPEWEDADARRRRKREEGLARRQQLRQQPPSTHSESQKEAEDFGAIGMF